MERAVSNQMVIAKIKKQYAYGELTKAEAITLAMPVYENIKETAVRLGKKYGRKPSVMPIERLIGL